jgi:hypothetical protein
VQERLLPFTACIVSTLQSPMNNDMTLRVRLNRVYLRVMTFAPAVKPCLWVRLPKIALCTVGVGCYAYVKSCCAVYSQPVCGVCSIVFVWVDF